MPRTRSAGSSTGSPSELDEQMRGAGLRVITLAEEITSRRWLKILAEVR